MLLRWLPHLIMIAALTIVGMAIYKAGEKSARLACMESVQKHEKAGKVSYEKNVQKSKRYRTGDDIDKRLADLGILRVSAE